MPYPRIKPPEGGIKAPFPGFIPPALATLMKSSDILLSQSFDHDGAAVLKSACAMGLEGVVSKRADSRYTSDRAGDWVKVTCQQRETLAIVGFGTKGRTFGGLYLGRHEGEELIYASKVDHGFSKDDVADVRAR